MVSRPTIAVIINFFIVGLGHMYLGQVKRGVIILVGGIALSFALTYWLGWWGILPMIGYVIWSATDAYKIGMNQERKKPEQFDAGWENKQ